METTSKVNWLIQPSESCVEIEDVSSVHNFMHLKNIDDHSILKELTNENIDPEKLNDIE